MAAMGLAIPWPAMSGAEPCTGSNIEGWRRVGSMFALGGMPRLPCSAPPRSVRMSPKRFEPTTTSRLSGAVMNRAARASTWYWRQVTSGYSPCSSRNTSSQNTMLYCMAFDLVTLTSSLRGRLRASSNP